jgi:hypothetical protein
MPKHLYNPIEPSSRTRKEIAWEMLGPIEWITSEEGYCRCPGAHMHTHRTGDQDCKIFLPEVGPPTIHCFHTSCKGEVEEANRKLRSAVALSEQDRSVTLPNYRHKPTKKRTFADDAKALENKLPWIRSHNLPDTAALPETAKEQYFKHLALFQDSDNIWLGDTYESAQIQPVSKFKKFSKPLGNFISHCTFVEGATGRKNEFVDDVKFLVVESDELAKPDQKAVLAWLRDWGGWNLRLVLDTAGKSLHGWFDYPEHLEKDQIKALLEQLKCDTRLLTPSQPSRIAGAMRKKKMQHIIWLGNDTETEPKEWDELFVVQPESLSDENGREWTVDDLLEYEFEDDPNTILGSRYLCKTGSLLLVGESGIGKSSLVMQSAVSWALGQDFFGIEPVQALKILVVQRENDAGDMAEELQGMMQGFGLNKEQKQTLKSNLRIIQSNVGSGLDWALWLEKKIRAHSADIVFIDPLLSFADGDITKQEAATRFLRHEIQPVLNRTQAAIVAAHHTNKPRSKKDEITSIGAGSYLGAGSAEFTNWARGVMTLTRESENVFILSAEKRGKRSGLTDLNENKSTKIRLKHSDKGIFWERVSDDFIESSEGVAFNRKTNLNFSEKGEVYRNKGVTMMPLLRHDRTNVAMSEVVCWIAEKLEIGFHNFDGVFEPDLSAAQKEFDRIRNIGANKGAKCSRIIKICGPNRWKGVEYEG